MELSDYFRQNEEYANQFFHANASQYSGDYCILKLYVNETKPELIELYRDHINKHNASLANTFFPNAGFDLFIPDEVKFAPMEKKLVNLHVKGELIQCKLNILSLIEKYDEAANMVKEGDTIGTSNNTGYYLYPRSSITKTDLMMSNHVGIIDSGYRGYLMASVRNLGKETTVDTATRLFQICHPSLWPIYVVMVEKEDMLTPTERGEGGFGSTGVVGSTVVADRPTVVADRPTVVAPGNQL